VPLQQDLLEQARHLAQRERKRPRQASLRRSVSSAYYAVFHLLISEAAAILVSGGPDGLKERIGRAFEHASMRQVCSGFVEVHNGKPGNKFIPIATQSLLNLPLDQNLSISLTRLSNCRRRVILLIMT
jgi:hypothetical protein